MYHFKGAYKINNLTMKELSEKFNCTFYCDCANIPLNDRILVKKNIIESIKTERTIINKPYISIHFRNTDRKNDINTFYDKIDKLILNTNINCIYLATDDKNAYDLFKNKYPKINFIRDFIPLNKKEGEAMHFGNNRDVCNKLTFDLLIDMYQIIKSDYFIQSEESGVSKNIVYFLRRKKNFFNEDINIKEII